MYFLQECIFLHQGFQAGVFQKTPLLAVRLVQKRDGALPVGDGLALGRFHHRPGLEQKGLLARFSRGIANVGEGQEAAQLGQSQTLGLVFFRVQDRRERLDVPAGKKVGIFGENLAQAHVFLEARADLVPLLSRFAEKGLRALADVRNVHGIHMTGRVNPRGKTIMPEESATAPGKDSASWATTEAPEPIWLNLSTIALSSFAPAPTRV